jgi:endosialidase-like protein/trimeric autotransporter adhesin
MVNDSRGRVRVGVTLVLLATASSPAVAQSYQACYTRGTGTVYRILEPGLPTDCKKDTPFGWTDGVGAIRQGTSAGGDLSGAYPNPLVVGLQGRQIAATAPTDGQELRFDQASGIWTPATPAEGVTDHGQLTGLADDDHLQYLLADGARASVNGFAVTGTLGTGIVPTTGVGTRLMWFPGNAALRAGTLSQSNAAAWDQGNLGQGSLAVGNDVSASGIASSALGNVAVASGDYSTAIGNTATASGNSSAAMGFLAVASGITSMALGQRVTASGNYTTAMGYNSSTAGQEGSFVYGDHAPFVVEATAPNQFVVRASGGFQFRTLQDLSTGCNLPSGSGSWDCSSSVTLKTDFEPVDGEAILARVRQLPVQRWSYRGEVGVRHMGAFAEDFRRAFGLGTGDKTIGMIDMDGVNLAAIQALERRTQELQARMLEREREIQFLRSELANLVARLEQLERGR